jgi:hypothetical protein
LLDESFAKHVADNNKRIEANAEFEGLSAMTDGLTNLHTPLVNVLTGTPEGVILNKIVDCSDHCATGGTKDALFLVNEIWPVLEDTWPRCYDQSQGLFSTTQTWLCVCAKKNSTAREACANASELIESPSLPLATSISNPLPTLGVEATLGVNVGTFVRRTSEGRVDTYKPIRPRAATTQPLYTVEPTTVKQAPAPHHTTLIL